MFVSSYSTYIQSNTSDKTSQKRLDKVDSNPHSFAKELKVATTATLKHTAMHVDYISTKTVLHNKHVLDKAQNKVQDTTQENVKKFTQQNSLINSKSAYEGNSKMFSLFKLPNTTLNQTPSLDKTLPKEPKEMKELNMRHKMVNTYIANDNYYKITA